MILDFSTTTGLYEVSRKERTQAHWDEALCPKRPRESEDFNDPDRPTTPKHLKQLRNEIEEAFLVDESVEPVKPDTSVYVHETAEVVGKSCRFKRAGVLREVGGIQGWRKTQAYTLGANQVSDR